MHSSKLRGTRRRRQEDEASTSEAGKSSPFEHGGSQLLRFSLRFDPYSKTAHEDYERLKEEIKKFDIIRLLKEELAKSKVHTALARKIVSAIRYLDPTTKNDAVLSILDNCDVLYPNMRALC